MKTIKSKKHVNRNKILKLWNLLAVTFLISSIVNITFVESISLKNSFSEKSSTKTSSETKTKYFIKNQPKIINPMEFSVSAEPLLAYDVYPGIQRHTLDLVYNEFMPGADIAQIEVGIGKMLPGNLPITLAMPALLSAKAAKVKSDKNQEWRFNRKD